MEATAMLKTISKELAGASPEEMQTWLDLAGLMLEEKAWGSRYTLGLVYLAAHLAAAAQTGAKGAVTSQSAGGVSRSYATPSADASAYASTAYGRQFLELRRGLGFFGLVGGGPDIV